MREIDDLKRQVIAEVDRRAPRLWEAAQTIGRNPELGHQEHQAVRMLTGLLADGEIEAEVGIAGLATAWWARIGRRRRPTVAILAAFDALPNIGHGCGHNLIGPAAVGAGLALQSVSWYLPGSVVVLGTPAEESTVDSSSGKVHLLRAGVFDDVDASIMFHPSQYTTMGLEVRESMPPYEDGVPNRALARAFRRNLEAIGLTVLDSRPDRGRGSTDFVNVTRQMPAIEAGIAVVEPGVPHHSAAFAEAALSEKAHGAVLAAAKGLAMTAIDILADPSLLAEANAEFDAGPGQHLIPD